MNGLKQALRTGAVAVMLLAVLFGGHSYAFAIETPAFTSFRDIPGVTAEEVAAVEALQNSGKSLNPLFMLL